MKKQIRNKVLIVLAGLSFVGITAGVGVGVQKSALRSSYLAQFDNDKSETELQPPINDAELAGVISNFSLKPEWSKISAAQAFKLHKDPLYAFKLSQAVDFSKIDKKFSNLFFNIQVNENTTVEGNAIKNLTVFVFDNITKKEVATRAFKTDLSGFSSVAKEDFIDNFIADSSTYDLDKSLLKTNFATEAVLPSAFSIKFQDQLLTHLRKISPQSFETPKTTQVSAISNLATEFQQQNGQDSGNSNGNNQGGSPNQNNSQSGGNSNGNQGGSSSQNNPQSGGNSNGNNQGGSSSQNNPQSGGNSNDGQNSGGSGGSGGSTQTDGNQSQTDQTGGAGQGQGSEAQKPNEETPKEVEPKKEESPSSKLVISNENLASALADTLKTFGGLKLVAASGLQGLIPNDYTLLPVSSDKSLVKVVADDQAGTAKISLKLLDKSNQEKLIELQITGLSSVGAIKDAISAKITRNQSAYLTLRPQVAEYFKKNQTKNISELISSFSKHKDKLDGYKKQLGDKYKDKDLIEELLKQLKERQQQTTQQPEEQQVSVSTTSTTEFQQQQQQSGGNSNGNNQGGSPNQNNGQSDSSSGTQTQSQGSNSGTQTQSQGSGTTPEKEKEKNDLVKKFLADFDGASASLFGVFGNNYETFPKDSEGKIIFPDKADFWFDLKDKKLEYQNYKFSFSIPEQKDKNDPNKLTLNLDIHPSQDLKLEVDEKNRQYIDVPEQAQYFEYDKSGKKKIEGVLVPVQTDAASSTETNSVFAQDRRYSGFTFKKWSYPIEIDLRGTKVQQELAKLVGNFHQAELNKKNRYQLFDYDLDKIFKTAKLENWFSLSDAEKNQAKTYLKASLNSISEELELPKKVEEPKVDQEQKQPETPAAPTAPAPATPAPAAPAPSAPNSSTQTQSGNSGSSAGTGTQGSGQSSSSQNGSASQSSSGTAAVQSSSSVSVKVQNFQQESTDSSDSSTKEPEKLAFGDYLIKYLDLFSTFKTEQGQKLSLKGEYDRASRTYNFVFAVLDSQNEQVASALFQLHGVNATNVAFTKALPYAPDVFVDGRSGLEYEKDRDKSYVSALSSINNTNVAYVANKKWVEPEKDIDKILKDLTAWSRTPSRPDKNKHNYPEQENEKADDGIKLNFPLRYDYKRENPHGLNFPTRERVEKTTLTKGVLYFVFRPEKVLGELGKLGDPELQRKPYKLLSTTKDQENSEFGLSSLELFKDDSSTNKELKIGWAIRKARPLNTEFKTLVSSQLSAKTIGLVVLEDKKQEDKNSQWIPAPKKYKSVDHDGELEPEQVETTDSKLVNDLQLKQTSPSDSLENYLGKTWLLELQITSNSVVLTIIPEQQTSGGKLKVWRSEIGPRFNSEINKDPETNSGQIFGRGFDFGQIGDFVESNSEEDGDTGQQKTNKPGMTFKALAVFRGDRLLNDATSRNQMRQAFIDQYFKK